MKYLITGNAGSGKTTVSKALKQRGYTVYDADEGFGHWIHKNSGEIRTSRPATNRKDYYWMWSIDRIERLLKETKDNTVFFCGFATNQAQLYKDFDKIVMLNCDLETIKHRLRNRQDNPFGKRPGDLDWVLKTHNHLLPQLPKAKAIDIDATFPLDKVVDMILEKVEAHGL